MKKMKNNITPSKRVMITESQAKRLIVNIKNEVTTKINK